MFFAIERKFEVNNMLRVYGNSKNLSYVEFRKKMVNRIIGKLKINRQRLAREYLGLEVYQ